ncbi:putative cytochrome p450 [Xylaria sp. FL0043]|nr:putative cytochrome p450 [Xylaria sp. FL0043]
MSTIPNSTLAFEALSPQEDSPPDHAIIVRFAIYASFALILWRVWKFTIYPALNPSQPAEFPSWIPCHVVPFFRNSNGLFAQARKYLNNIEEPFALTILGITFYVVAEPKHSAEVYKATKSLSFEGFVQNLMRTNGGDEHAIGLMYSSLPVSKYGFPNPQGESLGALAQKMHIHQLHPGENLRNLQRRAGGWIDRSVNPSTLKDMCSYAKFHGSGAVEVPLYYWCSNMFVRLGQHVYFGEALHRINPDLPAAFFEFDECIWQMLYQYPNFLSGSMIRGRTQIIASLKKYFSLPKSERADGAAWLINAMEDEGRAIGIDDGNLAVMVFHLYFAINTNTRRTAFWLLTYLLENPSLLEKYRTETEPAFSGQSLVDPGYIQDGSKCPTVEAIWLETLRLCSWSASVRLVARDTVIGGKLLRKGNQVVVPNRLLHFDESAFGEDTEAFRPERWQKPDLAQSPSWRPFGGGKTMCSGRFLARYVVTCFVATVLRRFDLEKIGDPPFPRADVGRPTLGIISVKEGDDFNVRLSPRRSP